MGRLKRIFIAFAMEDEKYRNLLKGQSLHVNSPFSYTDMSVKDPYETEWKEKVAARIEGCDGVIVLISSNSKSASGQKYEIKTARDKGKPILGMYIYSDDHPSLDELDGVRKIAWSYDGIATFIDSLEE